MTIDELLELIAEHEMVGTVEAGTDHLDDRVLWVHVFEIPEVIVNLRGGEFLLTTGAVLATMEDADLRKLVQSLQERGAVGLGIEVSAENRRMTRTVVDVARDLHFPVVVFEQNVPFIRIIHLAHERLLAREMELLRRSAAIHEQLRSAAVHGLSPHGILTQFVTEFGGEMMFIDPAGLTLACEPGGEPSAQLLTELQADSPQRLISCDVVSAGANIGRLHYLPADDEGELDRAAVEQAAFVLALVSGVGSSGSEDVARSALVQRLAQGRLANGQELRRHALRVSQDFAGRELLMVCVRGRVTETSPTSPPPTSEAAAMRLRTAVRLTCTEMGIPHLLQTGRAIRVRGVVGVRQGEARRVVRALRGRLDKTLHRMADDLAIGGVGVAHTGEDSWEMQRSLESAQRAALLSALSAGEVRWADRLGGLAFLAEGVMRLGAHQIRLDEQSAERLGVLSAAGWNKSAAAQQLGVRRQTLYRFIDVMSRRLGVDLSTPAGQADATLLYYAHRLDLLAKGDGDRWVTYDA